MKVVLAGLLCALVAMPLLAATPGEQLRLAQEQRAQTASTLKAREARFTKMHAELKAKHATALREVRAMEAEAARLRTRINADQQRTTELSAQLGTRGEDGVKLQRLLRVFARDLQAQLGESPIAAQAPGRDAFFATLGKDQHNASDEDLGKLLGLLRQEMTESGRTARVKLDVRNGDSSRSREVLRIGALTSTAGGRYLVHDPVSGLQELERQPGWRDRRVARAFEKSTSGLVPMRIDPTSGAWLKAWAQQPDPLRPVFWAAMLLAAIMVAGAPVLRALKRRLLPRRAVPGPWWQSYNLRFATAVGVSELHLVALILLLIGIFGFTLEKTTLAQEEVMEAVTVAASQPAQQISQNPGGGAPAPRPLPSIPNLAPTSLTPVVAAPNVNVDVVMPNLSMPVAATGSAMLSKAFGGFAGGSGSGGGAGGGSGGSFGTGNMPGGGGRPLIPLSTARPQITDYAYRRGIEGWVVVVFTVGTNGRVTNIRIVDAEPKGLFEGATVESISNWIYEPTDRPREVTQRVEFKLDDYQYNWK